MDEYCIVATHLSALSSEPPKVVMVETRRLNPPQALAVYDNDIPVDHATYGTILHDPTIGSVLLRVIHGGVVVELTSLTTNVTPMRIILPGPVLPSPALFLEGSALHVILLTAIGSLFRVVIQVEGTKLWQDRPDVVYREHHIHNLPQDHVKKCFVHAQASNCVTVSLPHGSLLRLEAPDFPGYESDSDEEAWEESVFHHSSFLSSLTSFLPIHSGVPGASDIISIASKPPPTDIGHIWTLSRDRTLRLWKARLGCVASRTLPTLPNAKESNPNGSNVKYHLLDGERQNLVKVFSIHPDDQDLYVLAFIPISSSTSGGFFVLLDSTTDHLVEAGTIECPKHTAHCHLQDFIVHGNTLYTLWDKQGQSMVERMEIDPDALRRHNLQPPVWRASHYSHERELTPAYMEEQLLTPGSLTDKFLSAIVKPNIFSALTLRTALDRYIDACLSLPGPPPPQLTNTYSSLCENIAAVVGCTVTLNRDPLTGGYQHANYWTAMKRDWEGFVARCREVERSARWPLSISASGANDSIILVERERVGALVAEDAPICLRRMLELDIPPHRQYDLLAIVWTLRAKLGPQMLASLESRVVDIMHQEIAFSFPEILQDQAQRLKFMEILDEGEHEWFIGRLKSVEDIDAATRMALDSIGGLDLAVKKEYSDEELLHLPLPSQWLQSQAATYATTSIEARYELCLCLIILLFFLSEDLSSWDASLLAEVFAVFRGVAMLRYVSAQPAEAGAMTQDPLSGSDDVITQMRNMNMSGKTQRTSKSSLIHILVTASPPADNIAATAHNFLDGTGVLQSLSPAHATKHEIVFANRIRLCGFLDVTQELLAWLPRTPAATFLQSQVLLRLGRVEDAAQLLETVSGCFGTANLTPEDGAALSAVLPNTHPIDSQYSFYLYVIDLFRNLHVRQEVRFSQLAIQVAPLDVDTGDLWTTVVQGLTELASYEDAYATVMQLPYEKQRRECASQMAIHMCEGNAVNQLMSFDFGGLAGEVEAALAFKARNGHPTSRPCYSRILYTWYIQRGDYRNAALTMYQRARKLQDAIIDATTFVTLAEDRMEALSVAINALNLVDEKSAWIVLPLIPDPSRQQQKLSKYVPEGKYVSSKHGAEIVQLADMEYEGTLLRVHIEAIKREPNLLSSSEYLLPPLVVVMRLAQASQYSEAMSIAQSLKVDMTDIFNHLTNQCIRLTRNPGSVLQEDASGWLLTDNTASWRGTPSDRGWRFLQQSLDRYDGIETDHRYAKTALETILSNGRSLSPPPWLISLLEKFQPEYLIRISLRYDNIADAINYTYALVLKSDRQATRESSRNASMTWLPYALIDQVLSVADGQVKTPPNLTELRTALNNRIKRTQKYSQNVS